MPTSPPVSAAGSGLPSPVRSLGTIMATAASRSIGTKVGASLAVQGQQIIEDLRQPKS